MKIEVLNKARFVIMFLKIKFSLGIYLYLIFYSIFHFLFHKSQVECRKRIKLQETLATTTSIYAFYYMDKS